MCHDYTSYLLTITNDRDKPIITDIIAYGFENRTEMYVLVSVYNVPKPKREIEQHQKYSLIFNNSMYTNQFPLKSFYPFYSAMKFILPPLIQETSSHPFYGSFKVTLLDQVQSRVYRDISVCLRSAALPIRNTTICAYISLYNSVPEIQHWISYYDLMKIDKIIFYDTSNMYYLRRSIQKSPLKHKIEFIDWRFPQNVLEDGLPLQLNHQYAQAMSCFYRNKYASRFVLLCDVDEYFYVNRESFSSSLLPTIEEWVHMYPEKDALMARSNMMLGKVPKWVPRDQYIQEGKLFTYFRYKLPEIHSGRIKMILLSKFDGIFGLHDCFECNWICPEDDRIRLAHYKQNVEKRSKDEDKVMQLYHIPVLERRRAIFNS